MLVHKSHTTEGQHKRRSLRPVRPQYNSTMKNGQKVGDSHHPQINEKKQDIFKMKKLNTFNDQIQKR